VVRFPAEEKKIVFSPKLPALLCYPVRFLLNGYVGAISLGVKQPGRESVQSPPSNAKVKNEWR
jgi:hypothetical protein